MSNPKFKVLKPVCWGINQPGPDVLRLVEEDIDKTMDHEDVDMDLAEKMQDAGYIEIIGDDSEDDSEVMAALKSVIEGIAGKRDQKNALEAWGKDNLDGYDLDKSKSLEDCLTVLADKYTELTGE